MSQPAADAFHEALAEDDAVQLYERAPCGYLSTTPEGRIVKSNETFRLWTGYTVEDLATRTFAELLSVGGRIYHETHYSPMLRMQGSVREIALEVVRRDGSRLPVLVNARLERTESGEPRVVRIALFDATERRQYERELLAAKERAEQSEERARSLARTLQTTFIPPSVPTIAGLELAAAYRPAGDGTVVGGDFYDVFPITADEWIVVLGDVCGKGPEAAVVTAFARHTVRILALSEPSPRAVLTRLDRLLLHHGPEDRFCTCVLARLRREPDGWTATISVGGHPPPVRFDGSGEAELVGARGPLVGILPEAEFVEHVLHLGPGEGLVLYTDGITEARAASAMFGEERLLASVRRSLRPSAEGPPVEGVVSDLVAEALEFQSGYASDDIAAVAFAVPAAPLA